MRTVTRLLLACSSLMPLLAFGQEPTELTDLQKGMPPAVATLISRIVYCNHWEGEESYDAARAAEVGKAIARLRCNSVDADEAAALKAYGDVPGVRKAIAASREVLL